MKKLNIAFIFGGRSTEHDVSLASAIGIFLNFNCQNYTVYPIRISKEGIWELLTDEAMQSLESLQKAKGKRVLACDPQTRGLYILEDESVLPVDVVFPILHGTYGEDGALQGLLAMADIPCVGCGVLASSLGFDKILMKQVFIQNDLQTPDFIWFLRKKWEVDPDAIIRGIEQEINYPCFVKPANTGSSVGVNKAGTRKELQEAIDEACRFDRKILVEKGIDARELEISILGNDEPEGSEVGEVLPANDFYDYAAKYEDSASQTVIPADIPQEISDRIRYQAIAAFKALDCAGLARVDFLLEKDSNTIFINEVNTLPGFTPISMYPKLWEETGISYSDLLDRLIELALERDTDIRKSKFLK